MEDGELDAEVNHRVQSGWRNWKNVSGVLCDRRMKVKIKPKGKVNIQDDSKTSNGEWSGDMEGEEGA